MESFNGNTDNLKNFNESNLRISTSFRSNFTDPDTNCTLDFTQNRNINNIVKLNLNYVTICNNFYNVASYNNTFYLLVNSGAGNTVNKITVPVGYYDATALAALLQTLCVPFAPTLTITYSETLKRIVFNTNDAGTTILLNPDTLSANFNYLGNNFLYLIGAPVDGGGYSATNVPSPLPSPPALFGATSVYIVSNKLVTARSILNVLLPDDNEINRSLQSQNASEIMALGITSPWGTYQTYYDNGSARGMYVLSQGLTLDTVDLKVVDQFGNVLENGTNNTPIYYSFKIFYQ